MLAGRAHPTETTQCVSPCTGFASLGGTGGAAEGFGNTTGSLAVLAVWALIAGVLAVRTFRWD